MSDTDRLEFTMPSSSEYVGVMRLAISGIASRLNFTIEDIEDIKIAISEACTNAVQHGYGNEVGGRVTVVCDVHPDKLEIQVKDSGSGFETSILGTDKQKEASEAKLGLGLGLTFIKNLMDDSEIISEPGKGTTIRMIKNRPSVEAAA